MVYDQEGLILQTFYVQNKEMKSAVSNQEWVIMTCVWYMEIWMLHQYWFQPIAQILPARQMIFPSLLFLKIFPFPIIEYWCHLHFHGLRTPNEGINPWNLKFWANLADKICFSHIYKFGIGIWFSAVQWRQFPHRASVVRVHFDWFTGWWEIRNSAKNLPIICKTDNRQLGFFYCQ